MLQPQPPRVPLPIRQRPLFRLPTQPGVTETISPEILQFQKIEDSWSDAVNRRDQYGLELVLSPLFVDVSASGDVTTRNQQVAQVISGEDKTLYLTQKVVTVRMLGDIAVANGTYTLHHKVELRPGGRKRRLYACLRARARRLAVHQLAAHSPAAGREHKEEGVRAGIALPPPEPVLQGRQGAAVGGGGEPDRTLLQFSSANLRALFTARPVLRPGWGTGARTW